MKKFLKLFLIFTLVFTITFNYVKADPEDPGTDEPVLIASAPVVSIKGNNNTLILSWEAVENATSYVISRSTNAKKGFKNVKTVTGTTYTDTKLSYGTTYYYKVTAKGPNNTKVSAVVNKKVSPNKVVISSLKPGSKQVKITWGKTSNSGYYVFRSTDGKKWTKVATIKKNKTTNYTDKKLKSNKKYYYQVQAYQKVGRKTYTGSKSAVMTVVTSPAAPSVKAINESIYYINLRISKVSGAVKYQIYETPKKNGQYQLYDEIPYEDVNYWFSYIESKSNYEYHFDVDPYEMHYFKIRACSNDSCGSFTSLNAQGQLPKTSIVSAKGSKKNVALEWDYITGAEGYEIYRATSKNGKYSKIKTITSGTSYTDKSIKSNKTYYYKIRSYMHTENGKIHYSGYSSVRKVTTGSSAGVDSAMEDAKVINKREYFSKSELIYVLVYDLGYKESDAKKGVEKAKINFKENALRVSKNIIENSGAVTEEYLRQELSDSGFTTAEINYAVSKLNLNWHSSLTSSIQNDIKNGISKQLLVSFYTSKGFTEEQILSVIEELNVDFNEQAVKLLITIHDFSFGFGMSSSFARECLKEAEFEDDEIEYAIENCGIDWIEEAINAYRFIENNYYSRTAVEEYLINEYQFTSEEVSEALNRLNVNFNEVALSKAEYYVYGNSAYHYSVAKLTEMLQEDGFTEENIAYVFEELDYDFNESALEQARDYTAYAYHGKAAIISMLQGLGFTSENIAYALEELNIDYKESALTLARNIMYYTSVPKYNTTRIKMRSALEAEQFTDEEITYAINNIDSYYWGEAAMTNASLIIAEQNDNYNKGMSKEKALEPLSSLGFKENEIEHASNNIGSNDPYFFKEQAHMSAIYYLNHGVYSKDMLYGQLRLDKFTEEEARYAANSDEYDYNQECVDQINELYIGKEPTKTIEEVRYELIHTYGFTDANIDYAFEHTDIYDYVIHE